MNEQDLEEFEKWVASEDTRNKNGREGYFANNNNFTRDYWIAEKAWQAALEYERSQYNGMSLNRAIIDYNTIKENYEYCQIEFKEIEAKLAIAVEALEFYSQGYALDVDDSFIAHFEYGHMRISTGKRAREALASITSLAEFSA